MFSPQHGSSCEFDKGMEKTGCNGCSDSTVTRTNNEVRGVMQICSSFFSRNYRDAFSGHFNIQCIVIKLSCEAVIYCDMFLLEAWGFEEGTLFLMINSVADLFYKLGKQIERELSLLNHR